MRKTKTPRPTCLMPLGALMLAVGLIGLLWAPASASARFTRPFIRQLSVPNRPQGLAVDPVGNVYVLNQFPGSAAIDKFDSNGNPLAVLTGEGHLQPEFQNQSSTLALANATGDIYAGGTAIPVSTASSVEAFDPSGVFLNEWTGIQVATGVAVDNSTEAGDPNKGDVLVAERDEAVRLFSPSGAPVDFTGSASNISGNAIVTPVAWSVAVDGHGDIYVGGGKVGGLSEYNPEGAFVRSFTNVGAAYSVTFDPTNGHILVGEGGGVLELDSSGNVVGTIAAVPPVPPLGEVTNVAADSNGNLYVGYQKESGGVQENAVDEFGPGAFLPDVTAGGVSERTSTSTTVEGEINPEGVALTDCHFEYVSDAAFKATGFSNLSSGGEAPCVPEAGSIPVDSSSHVVQAALSGLVPGITYHFRLVATSDPSSLGGTADSAPSSFVTPAEPTIDSTSASSVSSSFADLQAAIDPHGSDTTYQFEYVDASAYEAALAAHAADPYSGGGVVPASPGDVGAGGADMSVVQQVGDLTPETEYHFRVVASNALGTVDGADETFATLPAGLVGLPDGRAYELVTPPSKGDGEDMFGATGEKNFDVGISSESGNQFLLDTTSSFGPFPGSGEDTYVFSRGSEGWGYKSLAAPNLGIQSLATGAFDPADLSQVGVRDIVGTNGEEIEDLVGAPGGPYTTIETGQANQPSDAYIMGASSDLSHVVLETHNHALAAGDSTQDPESYALYDASKGGLSLVNVNTNGTLTSRCGATLGSDGGAVGGASHNAVSSDGSKIFFTAPDPRGSGFRCMGEGVPPELYVREGDERTVEVSAPLAGVKDPDGMQPAVYVGASNDGSKVFFVTKTELTQDDEGFHDLELYEYDTETSTLTRVSRGVSGDSEGDVDFVPAISGDGSTVYFTSRSQLAPGAPVSGDGANLYHYNTNAGETTYVATVSPNDYPDSSIGRWYTTSTVSGNEVGADESANWFTTSDGDYLVFASIANLTGYDNDAGPGANCPDLTGAGGGNVACTEVYRYAFSTGTVTCMSCNPSGVQPVSNAEFALSTDRANKPAGRPPRPVSENGEYAFFDTADGLVPRDTNGQRDVYEWHDGVISLITSGSDAQASYFSDSSADGSNVFFGTHTRLVPQDTDGSGDLYDARIGGGFGLVSGAGPCEGDACDNPPPPPIDQTPASLSFSGLGNPTPEPAVATKTKTKAKAKPKKKTKARSKKKTKSKGKKGKARKSTLKRAHKADRSREAHVNGRTGK
jgi:hypothetical protein